MQYSRPTLVSLTVLTLLGCTVVISNDSGKLAPVRTNQISEPVDINIKDKCLLDNLKKYALPELPSISNTDDDPVIQMRLLDHIERLRLDLYMLKGEGC